MNAKSERTRSAGAADDENIEDPKLRGRLKATGVAAVALVATGVALKAGVPLGAVGPVRARQFQEAIGSGGDSVQVPSVTSDPAGAPGGSEWYRSDLGYLRYQDALLGVPLPVGMAYPTPGGAAGDASIDGALTLGGATIFSPTDSIPYSQGEPFLVNDVTGATPVLGLTLGEAAGSSFQVQPSSHDAVVFGVTDDGSGNVKVEIGFKGTGGISIFGGPNGTSSKVLFLYDTYAEATQDFQVDGAFNLGTYPYDSIFASGLPTKIGGATTSLTGSIGVPIPTKAGTVSDSDYTSPVDGFMAIDTTDNRLYIRYGGAWHYAGLT